MPHFVLTCFDKPDSIALRMATRPAHGAYMDGHMDIVRLAGPMLDDAGTMVGSMLVFECDSKSVVEDFQKNDPYTLAGLFQSFDIKGFTVARGGVG